MKQLLSILITSTAALLSVPQVANALRMGCELGGLARVMGVYERCVGMEGFMLAAPQGQPDYVG